MRCKLSENSAYFERGRLLFQIRQALKSICKDSCKDLTYFLLPVISWWNVRGNMPKNGVDWLTFRDFIFSEQAYNKT